MKVTVNIKATATGANNETRAAGTSGTNRKRKNKDNKSVDRMEEIGEKDEGIND